MTGNDFKAFRPFEAQLSSAARSSYARFRPSEKTAFSEAVTAWRGTPLTRQENSCPSCFLKVIKKVAEEYFRYKESPRGKAFLKGEVEGNETTEGNADTE